MAGVFYQMSPLIDTSFVLTCGFQSREFWMGYPEVAQVVAVLIIHEAPLSQSYDVTSVEYALNRVTGSVLRPRDLLRASKREIRGLQPDRGTELNRYDV